MTNSFGREGFRDAIRAFLLAGFLGMISFHEAYAGLGDKFEINIQATTQQNSETTIQGRVESFSRQYIEQVILTVRPRNIFYQEILLDQGQARKDTGIAFDVNGTVNCYSSKMNPFEGQKYRNFSDKTSRSNITDRSCTATSQLSPSSIDLIAQTSSTMVTKTKEYIFQGKTDITTTARISYDLSTGSCNVLDFNKNMSLDSVGLSGNFLNNSQRVTFRTVQSSCRLTRN